MNQERTTDEGGDPVINPFEETLVQSSVQEFKIFCKGRIGGLELTEDEASLTAYRKAFDLGMRTLKGEVKSEDEKVKS
jgi:hypothetical protein